MTLSLNQLKEQAMSLQIVAAQLSSDPELSSAAEQVNNALKSVKSVIEKRSRGGAIEGNVGAHYLVDPGSSITTYADPAKERGFAQAAIYQIGGLGWKKADIVHNRCESKGEALQWAWNDAFKQEMQLRRDGEERPAKDAIAYFGIGETRDNHGNLYYQVVRLDRAEMSGSGVFTLRRPERSLKDFDGLTRVGPSGHPYKVFEAIAQAHCL